MAPDRIYLVFCTILSVAGAIALGIAVNDWWFSVFVAAVFTILLGATAMQGVRLIRWNPDMSVRSRRKTGDRS